MRTSTVIKGGDDDNNLIWLLTSHMPTWCDNVTATLEVKVGQMPLAYYNLYQRTIVERTF